MKKIFFMVSFSLMILATLLLAGCGNQKAFAGQASGLGSVPSVPVVAESCDGDDTCEMNNAVVSGNVLAKEGTFTGTLRGDRLAMGGVREDGYFNSGDVRTNGRIEGGEVYARDAVYGGNVQSRTYLTVGGAIARTANGLAVNGEILSEALAGSGNAYACVDTDGKFFRSDVPCR